MIERNHDDELGVLMITVALITFIFPIMTVVLINSAGTGKPGKAIKKLQCQFNSVKVRIQGAWR